jgi:hypothetical protein
MLIKNRQLRIALMEMKARQQVKCIERDVSND